MKKFKNKLLTGLLATSALTATSLAAISLASCGNTPVTPVDPEDAKYFNINGDTLYGFKQGLTAEQKKEICKNGVLKLPAVKVIAENAFNGALGEDAPYATEIVIDSATKIIGKKAFYANRAETITWNDGVANSKCTTIDEEAFAFCTQLKSFAFPKALFAPMKDPQTTGVFKNAFFGCGKLATLDLTTFPQNYFVEQPSWIAKDAFDGISQTGNLIFTKPDLTTTAGEIQMYNCAHMFTRLTVAGLSTAWIECWPGTPDPTPWETQIKMVPYEYLDIEQVDTDYILKGATDEWKSTEHGYNAVLVPSRVTKLADDIHDFFEERTRKLETPDQDINAWLFNYTKISEIPAGACADLGYAKTQAYWPNKILTINDDAFNGCAWDNDFPNPKYVDAIGARAFQGTQLTTWAFNENITHVGDNAFADAIYVASLDFSALTAKPDISVWGDNVFLGTGTVGAGVGAQSQATIKSYDNKVDQYRIYTDFYNFLKDEGLGVTGDTPKWKVHPNQTFEIADLFTVTNDGKITGWATGSKYSPITELTKTEVADILSKIESFDGTLTIPSKINDITITTIDSGAFADKLPDTVTKLVIPSTITTIGGNAFKGNTSLTEVTIPNSVVALGQDAFADCSSLAKIILTSFVPTQQDWVGPSWGTASVFSGIATKGKIVVKSYENQVDQWRLNYGLKTILTLNGITFGSDDWTFSQEDTAVLVNIDGTGKVTGWASGTESTGGILSDTEKVKMSLDKYPDDDDVLLVIPASATNIAANAFYEWDEETHTGKSTIPSAFTKLTFETGSNCIAVGAKSFYGAQIKTVDFTNANLESIGDYAFANSAVETITALPKSLTYIGDYAFYGIQIAELVVPKFDNAITFGMGAFSGNNLLASIDMTAYGTSAPTNWTGDNIFDSISDTGSIVVAAGIVSGTMRNFLATKSDTIAIASATDWVEVTPF